MSTAPFARKQVLRLAVGLSEQPLRFLLGFKFDCALAMGNLPSGWTSEQRRRAPA
jgi:hypothetical protein